MVKLLYLGIGGALFALSSFGLSGTIPGVLGLRMSVLGFDILPYLATSIVSGMGFYYIVKGLSHDYS
jgi:hypothetical protein